MFKLSASRCFVLSTFAWNSVSTNYRFVYTVTCYSDRKWVFTSSESAVCRFWLLRFNIDQRPNRLRVSSGENPEHRVETDFHTKRAWFGVAGKQALYRMTARWCCQEYWHSYHRLMLGITHVLSVTMFIQHKMRHAHESEQSTFPDVLNTILHTQITGTGRTMAKKGEIVLGALRSRPRVCGRSFAGIAFSNPTGSMVVSLVSVVCFQLEVSATGRPIRPEESYPVCARAQSRKPDN
jgi:hypothetical protein